MRKLRGGYCSPTVQRLRCLCAALGCHATELCRRIASFFHTATTRFILLWSKCDGNHATNSGGRQRRSEQAGPKHDILPTFVPQTRIRASPTEPQTASLPPAGTQKASSSSSTSAAAPLTASIRTTAAAPPHKQARPQLPRQLPQQQQRLREPGLVQPPGPAWGGAGLRQRQVLEQQSAFAKLPIDVLEHIMALDPWAAVGLACTCRRFRARLQAGLSREKAYWHPSLVPEITVRDKKKQKDSIWKTPWSRVDLDWPSDSSLQRILGLAKDGCYLGPFWEHVWRTGHVTESLVTPCKSSDFDSDDDVRAGVAIYYHMSVCRQYRNCKLNLGWLQSKFFAPAMRALKTVMQERFPIGTFWVYNHITRPTGLMSDIPRYQMDLKTYNGLCGVADITRSTGTVCDIHQCDLHFRTYGGVSVAHVGVAYCDVAFNFSKTPNTIWKENRWSWNWTGSLPEDALYPESLVDEAVIVLVPRSFPYNAQPGKVKGDVCPGCYPTAFYFCDCYGCERQRNMGCNYKEEERQEAWRCTTFTCEIPKEPKWYYG